MMDSRQLWACFVVWMRNDADDRSGGAGRGGDPPIECAMPLVQYLVLLIPNIQNP